MKWRSCEMDPKRLMKQENLGTIILGFISIRLGLVAPPGLSVSVLQIPQESLTGNFQEKFKEKGLALPSTWLTNQGCVTDQILPGMGIEGQNACCMCPHEGLPSVPETQPPITAELPCLATGRDEKWMTKSA